MSSFLLGIAAVQAAPVFFSLMCFAVLSAFLNAWAGRYRVISGVSFLMVFAAMILVNLPLGGAGLLLALTAQAMNLMPAGAPRSDAPSKVETAPS